MLNFILTIAGVFMFVAGLLTVWESIKKRNWNEAPTGFGMIVLGAIIILAAINLLFR